MKLLMLMTLFGLSLGAPQQSFPRDQSQQQPRRPPNPQPPRPFQQQPPLTRSADDPIRTLRFENVNNGDGTYNFGYETENGITAEESSFLRQRGANEDPIQTVKGFFQYFAPKGEKYRVDYTADEKGFVPKADHLPTPPPIPEAIMKSLAIIYANAERQKQAEQNRNRF